jgi:hypothetical protein
MFHVATRASIKSAVMASSDLEASSLPQRMGSNLSWGKVILAADIKAQ